MNSADLFDKLVQAETEDAVEAILRNAGYMSVRLRTTSPR